jgi:tetratricopeptide (TPR) repeat protein
VAAAPAPTSGAAVVPAAGAVASTVGAERGKQLSAMYDKAVAAMNAGQSAEAETLFKSIVAELPALAAAHYELGVLYGLRNAPSEAEAEFRKVIELEPKLSSAYIALATILGATKRSQEAYELLLGAAGDFEQDARYQFSLGANAFNVGRNTEAEAAFNQVIALDPANAEAYFNLGSLALNRNDPANAVQRLEKYVSIAPAGAENLAAANALIAQLKKK